VNALDPRCASGVAIELVPVDQLEHDFGGRSAEAPHALTALATEHRFELRRIVFEAGNDLAAVAARRTPTGLLRIDHQHIDTRFREMQRGREAQVACADDEHAGRFRAFERWHAGRRHRSLLPDVRVPRTGEHRLQPLAQTMDAAANGWHR
jgi:hypothetical protein